MLVGHRKKCVPAQAIASAILENITKPIQLFVQYLAFCGLDLVIECSFYLSCLSYQECLSRTKCHLALQSMHANGW